MRLNEADKLKVKELATKYGRPIEEVTRAIESQYTFIRKKTKELDIEPGLSREEFDKLKTNFNIPSIGKLYASYYIYTRINNYGKKNNKEE